MQRWGRLLAKTLKAGGNSFRINLHSQYISLDIYTEDHSIMASDIAHEAAAVAYEDEEEIEVTDDEGAVEAEEESGNEHHSPGEQQTPAKQAGSKALSGSPGEVEASKQGRGMKLSSPEAR